MKSRVLSAVIGAAGLAGLAVTSYGQGTIFFDNYDASPYYPIIYGYGDGGLTGTLAGGNVNAELGYALGANQTMGFTIVPSSITSVNPATPGYFEGPIVTIPSYISGPITFEILVWTADGFFDNLMNPTIWTEPSIPTLPSPAGLFTALPGNIVIGCGACPEPSTMALAGLGALFSLAEIRRARRKRSLV
jgi:hypothetical protein